MSEGLVVGARIAERFELTALIGEGGMGAVWAARHVVTGKSVALKVLKGKSAEHRRRFVQEARVAAAIRDPNVTEVHDVLELEDGQPFLVMDLLEGEPLGDELVRRGALPVDELMPIVLEVLAGLGAAHAAGVVHRDRKPDNVFLARGPHGERVVKVLDFGIAKLTAMSNAIRHTGALTQTGSVLGTPLYMAPEQVLGEKDLDHRADFWSLGVVIYESLTGTCPIQGDNIGQIFKSISQRSFPPLAERMPELDRELARLVDRMLSTRRDDRPSSARAIAEVIARRTGLALPPFPDAPHVTEHLEVATEAREGVDSQATTMVPPRTSFARAALGGVPLALLVALLVGFAAFRGGDGREVTNSTPAEPPAPKSTTSAAPADPVGALELAAPSPTASAEAIVPSRVEPKAPTRTTPLTATTAKPRPDAPSRPASAAITNPGGIHHESPY
jgi:serine/threonine-protein kinase